MVVSIAIRAVSAMFTHDFEDIEVKPGTDSVFKWIEEFPNTDPSQPELF